MMKNRINKKVLCSPPRQFAKNLKHLTMCFIYPHYITITKKWGVKSEKRYLRYGEQFRRRII